MHPARLSFSVFLIRPLSYEVIFGLYSDHTIRIQSSPIPAGGGCCVGTCRVSDPVSEEPWRRLCWTLAAFLFARLGEGGAARPARAPANTNTGTFLRHKARPWHPLTGRRSDRSSAVLTVPDWSRSVPDWSRSALDSVMSDGPGELEQRSLSDRTPHGRFVSRNPVSKVALCTAEPGRVSGRGAWPQP